MKTTWVLCFGFLAANLFAPNVANLPAQAAEAEEASDPAAKEGSADQKPGHNGKTLEIEPSKLLIRFESEGVFVAREMEEIRLEPEEWSTFKIQEIVPHGTKVHKGQLLVRFEDKDLKKALEELELEQRLEELALITAEENLPRKERDIQLAFEQAERALEKAVEEYENYQEVDRDIMIKSLEMQLKRTEQYTENAREELRQLEKMYEADDLTEETEEIILKRQRAAVEQAEFSLEQARISHERGMKSEVPRSDIREKVQLEQAKLAFARAKTAFETDSKQVRYELEKLKNSRQKSLEKHANLTSDLNLLTLKSPIDGVVYYGSATNGKWSDTASQIKKLKQGQTVATGATFMTVVQPRPLYVLSTAKEADRPSVELGQSATVTPTPADQLKLKATVASVSDIPIDDGKFLLELDLPGDDLPDWLVAGMTGKVQVVTYEKKDAILIPKSAVHTDDSDEDQQYVWLVKDGERERRDVTTGKTKDDQVEITDGLSDGDVISLENEVTEDDDEKDEESDDDDESEDTDEE